MHTPYQINQILSIKISLRNIDTYRLSISTFKIFSEFEIEKIWYKAKDIQLFTSRHIFQFLSSRISCSHQIIEIQLRSTHFEFNMISKFFYLLIEISIKVMWNIFRKKLNFTSNFHLSTNSLGFLRNPWKVIEVFEWVRKPVVFCLGMRTVSICHLKHCADNFLPTCINSRLNFNEVP